MIKKFLVLFFAALSFVQMGYTWDVTDNQGDVVSYTLSKGNDLSEHNSIFINTFRKLYENTQPSDLGIADKETFFQTDFESLRQAVSHGDQQLVEARIGGKLVGFVSFAKTDTPNQVTVAHLAVTPEFKERGIETELIHSAQRIYPNVNSILAFPRKINKSAQDLFKSIGFTPIDYVKSPSTTIPSSSLAGYELKLTNN